MILTWKLKGLESAGYRRLFPLVASRKTMKMCFTRLPSPRLSHTCLREKPLAFEQAGPREKIYFDPSKLKCGIVTCGGLCPGLNDVIRSIVLSLHFHYGVKTVFGFPYGYEGLSYRYGHTPWS